MRENFIAQVVVDSAFKVHVALGPGLLESVYQSVLEYELARRGLPIAAQVAVPVHYGEVLLDKGFIADIVEQLVIVELKSVEEVSPLHKKQLQTYLKLTGMKLGLLINFNVVLIKNGIHRVANGMID